MTTRSVSLKPFYSIVLPWWNQVLGHNKVYYNSFEKIKKSSIEKIKDIYMMKKKEFRKIFRISVILYHAAIVSQFPALPVFTSYVPDFRTTCDEVDLTNSTNVTGEWNQCHSECDSYYFDSSLWRETTTTEFELVCDREWYRDIPNYALYTGICRIY